MTSQEMAKTTGSAVCCWNTYQSQCTLVGEHEACHGCRLDDPDGCSAFEPNGYKDIEGAGTTVRRCGADVGNYIVNCEQEGNVVCFYEFNCVPDENATLGECLSNYDDNCEPGPWEEEPCYKCTRDEESITPKFHGSSYCPGGTAVQ